MKDEIVSYTLDTKNLSPAFLVIEEHGHYMNMCAIEIFTHVSFGRPPAFEITQLLWSLVILRSFPHSYILKNCSISCRKFSDDFGKTWILWRNFTKIFKKFQVFFGKGGAGIENFRNCISTAAVSRTFAKCVRQLSELKSTPSPLNPPKEQPPRLRPRAPKILNFENKVHVRSHLFASAFV